MLIDVINNQNINFYNNNNKDDCLELQTTPSERTGHSSSIAD